MDSLTGHLAAALDGTFVADGPFAGLPCVETPGGRIDLDFTESRFSVRLRLIQTFPQGAGLGTAAMNAIRAYCDTTQKVLEVEEVENPEFFRRFDWLIDWDDSFSYEPA